MRENRTYGLMRGRAYPTRDAPLYSTTNSGGVAIGTLVATLENAHIFAIILLPKKQ